MFYVANFVGGAAVADVSGSVSVWHTEQQAAPSGVRRRRRRRRRRPVARCDLLVLQLLRSGYESFPSYDSEGKARQGDDNDDH